MIEHTFTPKSGQQYHVMEKRIRSLMSERDTLLAEDGSSNDSDPRDGYVRHGDATAGPASYSPRPGKSLTLDGTKITHTNESKLNGYPTVYNEQYDIEASTIASSYGYVGDTGNNGTFTSLTDSTALLKTRQTLLEEATETYRSVSDNDNSTQPGLAFDDDPRTGHYATPSGDIQANFGTNHLSYQAVTGSKTVCLEVDGACREFTPEQNSIKRTTHINGSTAIVETSPTGTSSSYHIEDPAEFFSHFWPAPKTHP